ncbi:NUDIX hydrolase [Halobacterium jilantaiense]|uniref:ADP-ribose pyrophosphatase n=1 Tax=Halobacterium jilantaiense TaxID=355548 RepID=A0A1I0PEG2_9EURY|nr:NUDIX hydrolase [Halobacterium jilantaiense]SEW12657.1 ADP-ribose pyrophosphatase [Halobacterium jilantaiense]
MSHDWPVVESRTEYETGWYDGGYDRVEQPDGSEKNYYWAALPPAVVVVAVDDGDVVFVDQYRPTIREQCMELVAGIVEERPVDEREDDQRESSERASGGTASREDGDTEDDDAIRPHPTRESYAAAGRRELREETGFEAGEMHFLEEFWTATGVLRHKRGIVFAEDLTPTERDLDDNEFLTVERVPVEEALDVARAPPANDATIEGLLLAEADGHL